MAQITKPVDTSRGYLVCDPNVFPANLHHSFQEDQPEKDIPVIPYEGYNFLPTSLGYKSFFGANTKLDINSLAANVDHTLLFQFVTYQNCLVALCDTGIFTAITETEAVDWVQQVILVPPVGGEHLLWTYTVIENKLYMYIQGGSNVYVLAPTAIDEFNDITITTISPNFLNMAGQMGIFRANGRLGFWDSANSVSWSSALDLADFSPSVTTLAGNGIFTGIRGRIITILPQGDGFIIYTTKNIVGVRYAAKDNFLWEANSVIESAGIVLPTEVTFGTSDLEHYAWTSSGIKKIGLFDIVSRQQKVEEVFTHIFDLVKEDREPVYLQFINGRYLFISTVSNTYIDGKISFVWDSTGEIIVQVLTGGDYWDPDIVVPPFTYLNRTVKPVIVIDPLNTEVPVGGGDPVVVWFIYVDIDGDGVAETLVDQITVSTNQMSQLIKYSLTAGPWTRFGKKMSRWEVTGQALQYFFPFPNVPWYDVGVTDLQVDFLPEAFPSPLYALRTSGINDQNVIKQMYAQVKFWEDFKINRLVGLTRIAAYQKTPDILKDFSVVTVYPGDPSPVMGVGTYATVVEETDLGNMITGLGTTVFEKNYVPAEVNQQQWFRLARHFQQVRKVKHLKVTSYSIERIELSKYVAYAGNSNYQIALYNKDPENFGYPGYGFIGFSTIPNGVGDTAAEAKQNYAGYLPPAGQWTIVQSGGGYPVYFIGGTAEKTTYDATTQTGLTYTVDVYGFVRYYIPYPVVGPTVLNLTETNNYNLPIQVFSNCKIYHITRTIEEYYEVSADPGAPDGQIYATSEITGYETYRDDIKYIQGRPEITGTLEFTPPTLPNEGYPIPAFDPNNPTFKFYGFPMLINYGGMESQNPFDLVNGTFGEEPIGEPLAGADELVTIPGYTIKGQYHLPITAEVILPGSRFLMQTGTLGPAYPTFSGALVYDTSLEKWGKCKASYKQLFDFSPINSTVGQSIPYSNFGVDVGMLDATGDCYLFDQYPVDSFIRYGKIGLSRNAVTQLQNVKVNAVTPFNGTVTIDSSIDGRSLELTAQETTDITGTVDVDVPARKTGKWHTVSFSGIFDISQIAFTANRTARR